MVVESNQQVLFVYAEEFYQETQSLKIVALDLLPVQNEAELEDRSSFFFPVDFSSGFLKLIW